MFSFVCLTGVFCVFFHGGSVSASTCHKSAFTAVLTKDSTNVKKGDVLANWDEVSTNKGDDFNQATGKFTCRVPGTYAFMFSCMKWGGANGPVCRLNKNGNQAVVGVWVGKESQFYQTTNGATLDLAAGDQVWIEIVHRDGVINSNSYNKYTSFTGFLLFED